MSYAEAKTRYAAIGVDTEAAIARLKAVPISLHCWQGDDVRGFDTDPTKPLTGGIQTTGNYPGRARTPEELMADIDKVLSLCPGTKKSTSMPPMPFLTRKTRGRPGQTGAEALQKMGGFLQGKRAGRRL